MRIITVMHSQYSGFGSELVSIMFDHFFKVLILQCFTFVGFSILLISKIGKILNRKFEALKRRNAADR